jgi:stage IV sporulation protein FB
MGNRIVKIFKKSPIHPSFFLFFFWFLLNNNIQSFFAFTFVILIHEFGHYIVAKRLGYRLNSFYIAPYGVNLNYNESFFDSNDEVFIAIAGPLANLLLSCFTTAFWWIIPASYCVTQKIVYDSLMLGLFNLLPCYPLDGGRIVCGLLGGSISRQKAIKIIRWLNYVFSASLFALFVLSCFINFNPTFLCVAVFLVIGNIDSKHEGEYLPMHLFEKKVKSYSKPNFVYVNKDEPISRLLRHIDMTKFTIFIVETKKDKTIFLDENFIKKLSLSYPLNTTLKEVFIQEKE